jgi:hypothetical protein
VLCLELNGHVRADRAEPDARKTYETALELAEKIQHAQRIGSVQLALAMLDVDEGQEALALGRTETVQLDAQKRGATGLESHAWIVLARTHLEQAESQKSLADLEHVKHEPQALRMRVLYRLVEGLTHHSLGDPMTGGEKIAAARSDAEKQACVGLVLEARFAQAQLLPPEQMKTELAAIISDANTRGFRRIAKLAETASQQ